MTISFERAKEIALANNAKKDAVKQWYCRGHIPLAWQVKIIQASTGFISLTDMEVLNRELADRRERRAAQ